MIPTPVLIAAVVLVGWPTLKLGATLVSRRLWTAAKAERDDLLRNETLTEDDKILVQATFLDAYGTPFIMLLPVAALIAMPLSVFLIRHQDVHLSESLGSAIERISKRNIEDRIDEIKVGKSFFAQRTRLLRDKRYTRLLDVTFLLGALRYPVASFLSFAVIGSLMWIPMMAFGLHFTTSSIKTMTREWIELLRAGSTSAVRAMRAG